MSRPPDRPPAAAAGAGYSSPNDLATGAPPPPTRRRSRPPEVRGPGDLVLARATATGSGVDAAAGQSSPELARIRERVAFLEGQVQGAAKLEAGVAAELERAREQHRAELERLRSEQGLERERGRLEAAKLREVLDQRERELRTLVLEMGKTEGRLEVAERKLLEAHRAVAAARTVEGLPASSARGGRRVLTQAALALCAVAAVYTLLELALSSRALRQVEAAPRPLLTLASELRALGEDQRRTALDALLAGELPEYPQLAAPLPPFQRDELRRWAEAELGYRSASSDDSVAGN